MRSATSDVAQPALAVEDAKPNGMQLSKLLVRRGCEPRGFLVCPLVCMPAVNSTSHHGPPMKSPPRNEVDANAPEGLPRDMRLRLPMVLYSDA